LTQSPEYAKRFDRIFDLHNDVIQVYCLRRLPTDDVNDAVAEVFLVAWRRIDQAPEERELPWLYGIARNVVRNTHRSRRRYSQLQRRVGGTAPDAPVSPEVQVVQRFEDQAVLEALATLSDKDQEVLRLKTWEEMSNGDIAAVLGTSKRAVDMRISRSRKRLAKAYEKSNRQTSVQPSPRFVEEGGER
jgi:RNA polymerase sigma-70 factor (ECF subfamily)